MAKMRPKIKAFYDMIRSKHEGEIITDATILSATGWSESTLDTHKNKNALAPFLDVTGPGQYRVRRDGSAVTDAQVNAAFTQIRPTEFRLSPGTKLKGGAATYELDSELGRGAVAHVWKAKHIVSKQLVALKIMNPRPDLLAPDVIGDVRHRFKREARNGAKIADPYIVSYLDHGEYQEHPFLVMELADETLAARLAKGRLTVPETLPIIADCAKGLQHLEKQGCPHRDIKPDNILRFGETYKLGDLGVVRWSDMNPAFTSAGSMTAESMRLGSWYYMAPEQRARSHDAVVSSDIYALGISWMEMLSGSTSDPATVAAQEFDAPCEDEEVCGLIRRMLKYRPDQRPTLSEILTVTDRART
jgi:serine/threonine protein kinase